MAVANQYDAAGTRAVALARHEWRRQCPFERHADAGVGQEIVGRGGGVGQCIEQGRQRAPIDVVRAGLCRCQPGFERPRRKTALGPGRIEGAVRHRVQPRRHGRKVRTWVIAGEHEHGAVPQQQVETAMLAGGAFQRRSMLDRLAVAAHEIAHQPAARARRLCRPGPGAHVGHGGEPPAGRNLQPASTLHEIAPAIDWRCFGIEAGGGGGAKMEFVAIGDQGQRIAAVGAPGEGDQAHGD